MEQIWNYIKVAIRSLYRYRSDAILNVFGLSIGITISLVVLMYVRYESGYDKCYLHSAHTFRVVTKGAIGNNTFESAMSPMPMSSFIRDNFKDDVLFVTKFVRGANKLVSYQDKKFNEDNFFYADSTFFKVFDLPFIHGNANTSLKTDEDVVITTLIAKKYFGFENPIGKTLELDNGLKFKVSGVCEPQPSNSHFQFDFIASQQSIRKLYLGKDKVKTAALEMNWLRIDWYTYFVLKKRRSTEEFENKLMAKLQHVIKQQVDDMEKEEEGIVNGVKEMAFSFQKLHDIHLNSDLDNELESNSKQLYVLLFSSLALFVLLISCINFMNLTTARASLRIKEIGVRKLVGGDRKALVIQFIVEAVTYSFVALFIGLVLVELLLPLFNMYFNLNLKVSGNGGRLDLLYVIALTVIVGVVSGIYPAISFSGLKETTIFQQGFIPKKSGLLIRGGLAALQLLVAAFLCVLSLGSLWQLQFLKHKDLGFDSKNILVVERGYALGTEFTSFKKEMLQIEGVKNMSACSLLPGDKSSPVSFTYSGRNGDRLVLMPINFVEKDFFKLIGVKFEAGGFWGKGLSAQSDVVINQKAKDLLDMNKPLGQRIAFTGNHKKEYDFSIKGVVKDFHYEPVQMPIRPLVLMDLPKGNYYENLLIKIESEEKVQDVIQKTKTIWYKFTANEPFEYKMLSSVLKDNLKEEKLVLRIVFVFMILSLLVAWLGLRAFALYVAEVKSRDLATKKVLGASSKQIFAELFLSISHFILPGILLSLPLLYIVLNYWYSGFAYYSRLPLSLMIACAGVLWGLSLIMVYFHTRRIIKSYPV